MKKIVLSLSLALALPSVEAYAGTSASGAASFLSSKEKCASALNSYLLYRHNTVNADLFKLEKLEYQIEAMCDGYEIRLVSKDGATRGIIEAVE